MTGMSKPDQIIRWDGTPETAPDVIAWVTVRQGSARHAADRHPTYAPTIEITSGLPTDEMGKVDSLVAGGAVVSTSPGWFNVENPDPQQVIGDLIEWGRVTSNPAAWAEAWDRTVRLNPGLTHPYSDRVAWMTGWFANAMGHR